MVVTQLARAFGPLGQWVGSKFTTFSLPCDQCQIKTCTCPKYWSLVFGEIPTVCLNKTLHLFVKIRNLAKP